MNRKELWENRLEFLDNVVKELSVNELSYKSTVGHKKIEKDSFRGLDGSVVPYGTEPRKKHRGKTVTFSKFYGALRDKMVAGRERGTVAEEHGIDALTPQNIWDEWIKGDVYLNTITDPGFQFTEESFQCNEFHFTIELYRAAGPEGDSKIDFAMMKALFHAGKMMERMRAEGYRKSDRPAKAGGTEWKNKVSPQDVIEEFYRMDTNGKTKNAICEEIRAAFIKRGRKEKAVYSAKWIRNILKDEWPKLK